MTIQAEARTTQTKEVSATQHKALVKWKGEQISVTFNDVKNLICPLATDQETVVFLRTCQSLQLNPFAKEIYLIKYGEQDKAAMVVAIDSYLKSAESNDNFNGFEAGIILKDSGGKLEFREGAILLPDESDKLAGGWARVYRKDRERPFYMAVNKAECVRYTKSGNLTQFWTKEKQPSMLRKTALKRALVEAFPSLFAGTLSNVEADYEPDDVNEFVPKPGGETLEGEVPPAFKKNGANDWKKFWARVKSELGLTTEQARELLHVDSIKEELIDAGRTMEDIWTKLVSSLQQQKSPENESEQLVDVQTGEGEEKASVAPADAEEQTTGTAVPAKPKRDPETIETINDLLKACNQDFKMQPKDVYKELGYGSQSDINEKPSICYQKIASVRG